jgi:hypothetical protein
MLGLAILIARFSGALRRAAKAPEFRGVVVSALILVASGTIVYSVTEHWSVIDGFYFAVSVLTTTTPAGLALTHTISKLYTCVYIVFGIGILAKLIRQIAVAYGEIKIEKRAANGGHSAS